MAEKVAGQIVSADSSKDAEPILLIIDSPGGDVSAGRLIASAILLSKHAVNTMCVGDCSSMAFLIFEMGKHRYMWPLSKLMAHQPHLQLSGVPQEVVNEFATVETDIVYFESMVAARIGLTLKAHRALVENELYVNASDAVARHFADEVVTSTQLEPKE